MTDQQKPHIEVTRVKGNDYLGAPATIQVFWERFDQNQVRISSEILVMDETKAIIKSTVEVFNLGGELDRSADGIKQSFASEFDNYLEKAQTGSVRRAMEFLGVTLDSLEDDRLMYKDDKSGSVRPRQNMGGHKVTTGNFNGGNRGGNIAGNKIDAKRVDEITQMFRAMGMTKQQVADALNPFAGATRIEDLTVGQASALEHRMKERATSST